jgi:hypothetical protein
VKALPSSYSIDFADNLYQVLTKASNRLTELVRDFAKRKGLDPSVEVIISLRRSTEADIKRRPEEYVLSSQPRVCGYYNPENKWIVLSHPCIADESNHAAAALRTLAHELIHHCHFTCLNHLCKDMCEKKLTISDSCKISEMLPYGLEPYEIEAYMKQDSVANEIRKVIGSEVETIIRRLNATLQPPLNEVAKQLTEISNLYSYFYLKQFVEELLNKFVGKEALAKKIATALNVVKDEGVRKWIEHELSVDKFISSYASALSKECWNESVEVKSIIIMPVQVYDKLRPKVFIATDAGFTISFTLDVDAPLTTIELKPLNKLPLPSLSQRLNSLKNTYLHHLANRANSPNFTIYLHTDVDELKVLTRIVNEMRCDERKSTEPLDKLISILTPVSRGKNIVVELLTIQGLSKELIRVRSNAKNLTMNEVLICGGKVRVGNKELDKERVAKSLLNPDSADKELVEAFNNHISERIMTEVLTREISLKELEELEKELQELEKMLRETEKKHQNLYI